jgi:hypothetical protein
MSRPGRRRDRRQWWKALLSQYFFDLPYLPRYFPGGLLHLTLQLKPGAVEEGAGFLLERTGYFVQLALHFIRRAVLDGFLPYDQTSCRRASGGQLRKRSRLTS